MVAAELLSKPVACEAVLQLQAGKDEIAAHLGEWDDAVEFGQPQQLLQNPLTDGGCPGAPRCTPAGPRSSAEKGMYWVFWSSLSSRTSSQAAGQRPEAALLVGHREGQGVRRQHAGLAVQDVLRRGDHHGDFKVYFWKRYNYKP